MKEEFKKEGMDEKEKAKERILYGVPVVRLIEARKIISGHTPSGNEPVEAAIPPVYEFPEGTPWAGKRVSLDYSDEIRPNYILHKNSDKYEEIPPLKGWEGYGFAAMSSGYDYQGIKVIKAEDGTIWMKVPGRWRYAELASLPTWEGIEKNRPEIDKFWKEVDRRFVEVNSRPTTPLPKGAVAQEYYHELKQKGLPIPYEITLEMGEK